MLRIRGYIQWAQRWRHFLRGPLGAAIRKLVVTTARCPCWRWTCSLSVDQLMKLMVFIYPFVEQTTLANMMIFLKKADLFVFAVIWYGKWRKFFSQWNIIPGCLSFYIYLLWNAFASNQGHKLFLFTGSQIAIMGLATALALKSEILKIKTKCVTGSFFYFRITNINFNWHWDLKLMKSFDSVGLKSSIGNESN